MAVVYRVANNRDLLTHIFAYLDDVTLKHIIPQFYGNLHYKYIEPCMHTLVYGEVQSGKTGKIIQYIKTYRPTIPKILILQNSTVMLMQYVQALNIHHIPYKIIDSKSGTQRFHNESVILAIHNKYRVNALHKYLKFNENYMSMYNIILDESDQYLHKIKNQRVFKEAKRVLHVTATPFRYKSINIDEIVTIRPKENYVGLKDVIFQEEMLYPELPLHQCVGSIIKKDFIQKPTGMMLITSWPFVTQMKNAAIYLSIKYKTIPIIVLTSKFFEYVNGANKVVPAKNIQQLIEKYNNHSHVILIANRLSNRGINYTNANYTRNITHQISNATSNYTSFIQKCRIFGVRQQSSPKPIIYCILKGVNAGYVNKLTNKLKQINNQLQQNTLPTLPTQPTENNKKITIPYLKKICRENSIRGFSKLKKDQLIELITEHRINIYTYEIAEGILIPI